MASESEIRTRGWSLQLPVVQERVKREMDGDVVGVELLSCRFNIQRFRKVSKSIEKYLGSG